MLTIRVSIFFLILTLWLPNRGFAEGFFCSLETIPFEVEVIHPDFQQSVKEVVFRWTNSNESNAFSFQRDSLSNNDAYYVINLHKNLQIQGLAQLLHLQLERTSAFHLIVDYYFSETTSRGPYVNASFVALYEDNSFDSIEMICEFTE